MKKYRSGFTLVEVSLFLAITALLFFGVAMGLRGSMSQQRYNDSVQNFAEFLRNIYSETANVEHAGTGTSDMAIYGKLVTFGETVKSGMPSINAYTVVGQTGDIGLGNVKDALTALGANVVVKEGSSYVLAGISEEYHTRWEAGLQTTDAYSSGYKPFKGSLLVVRHPRSGTIYTLFSSTIIKVKQALNNGGNLDGLLTSKLSGFSAQVVNFCVNPMGSEQASHRRNIRLVENARNASGVVIVSQDSTENQCK